MYFFNQQVLNTLASENIKLSPQEIQAYIADIEQAERNNRSLKTKKNLNENRRFSVWHSPASKFNKGVSSHYLVLSAPKNWKTKDEETKTVATKIFIDLLSGEKKFVKIRRPETIKQTIHLKESALEAENNELLNIPVDHYARFSEGTGTKAYLFQPYRGKVNLHDVLTNPATSSKELFNLLLATGAVLEKMHLKGYIHGDFKPHNVVLSDDKQQINLVDLEFMLTMTQGQKGVRKMFGSPIFANPTWEQMTRKNLDMGGLAYYSTANDVHAFLVTAEAFLNQAQLRESNSQLKNSLNQAISQMRAWRQLPLQALPSLSTVISRLKTIGQPQVYQPIVVKQMAPVQYFHRAITPVQFFPKPVVPVLCFPRAVIPQPALPLRILPIPQITRVFKF
jgi:serine/threonine protein kinase